MPQPPRRSRVLAQLRHWALPATLAVAGAAECALSDGIAEGSGLPAVFAAVMAMTLAWRSDRPMAALFGCLGVFAVQEVWGSGTLSEAVTPFVTLIIAMYAAGARLRRARLVAAAGASAVAIGGTILVDEGGLDSASLLYALVVVAAAFTAGRLLGQRVREADLLTEEKAALIRASQERERRAVARERSRIAGELHDLITHRVSAMVLQAATERRVVEQSGCAESVDPTTLATALESIESLGREAMSELRQLLGALSHEGDLPRAPQPGTADLPALVEQTARVHGDVRHEVEGLPRALPQPLEVSLYRIAQESLSNAMRHAPGSQVRLALEYVPGAVELTVSNTAGRSAVSDAPGSGLGIPGMRERTRQFGGALDVSPTADGGFEVKARFPTPDELDAEVAK